MPELGRYRLRKELGRGPYTVTYEAEDGRQRCVVKVFNADAVPTDPALKAGLIKALLGLKAFDHPSAVRVTDAGETDGKLFMVMEYMDCPTLEQKLVGRNSLPEQQAVLFIRQSAQALDKARDLGYCHGNLNPRNVFVVSEEKVKLTDFALNILVEDPPEVTHFDLDMEGGVGQDNEWVTAEDLLRSKSKKGTVEHLDEDFAGMALLMMRMLGINAPERAEGQSVETYREAMLRSYYPQATKPEKGISVHAAEVMRRLLTPGGFDSPGEVVVELASAMLLGRTMARPKPAAQPKPQAPASETAYMRAAQAKQSAEVGKLTAEAERRKAGPELTPSEPVEMETINAFYIWKDRRAGTFFVIHDGDDIILGRDPELSDVLIMDPAASRKHCALRKRHGVVTAEDLGSSNGTFVNDERIQTVEIRRGDKVRIGTTRIYSYLPGTEA